MDLKQLEYIIEIAKEKNITHAAKNLFITQSALNQQLLKLEKELGEQLFRRSRVNWQLTKVGEIYVENAKKILDIKKDAYNKIYDCLENQRKKLVIGLTPGRGIDMFTSVFQSFHKIHPDVIVEPVELSVYQQQQKIKSGEIDLGFMTLSKDRRTEDNYITIYSEEMVLVTSKTHSFNNSPKKQRLVNLKDFRDEPFVLMNKNSTNRSVIDKIFEDAEVEPKILFETTYTTSIVKSVESSLCCGIVPLYYAKKNSDILSYFYLDGYSSWDIVISYKKDSYLPKASKTFVEMTKKYFENI